MIPFTTTGNAMRHDLADGNVDLKFAVKFDPPSRILNPERLVLYTYARRHATLYNTISDKKHL